MPAPGGATNELAALRDELRRVQAESEALRHAAASNETTAAAYDILKTHVAQLEQENQELAARPAGPAAPAAPTATVAPVDAISLNLLRTGLAQEQLGNYASALAVYERAPAAGSNAAEVVKAKSRCLINLGRVDSAIDQLQTLITEQPKDSQAKVLLAIAFCRNRQFSNAIEILVPLATENPSDALAQSALGAAYMGLGNTDAAATALRKAVELDPANADAQFNLAQLLAESPRDVDQARAHYKQFLEAGGAHDPALDKALGVAP